MSICNTHVFIECKVYIIFIKKIMMLILMTMVPLILKLIFLFGTLVLLKMLV